MSKTTATPWTTDPGGAHELPAGNSQKIHWQPDSTHAATLGPRPQDHSSERIPWALSIPARSERDGTERLSRSLVWTDLVALCAGAILAQVIAFGVGPLPVAVVSGRAIPYPVVGAALTFGWWATLLFHPTRNTRKLGHGPEEYRRVIVATIRAFAALAIGVLAFKVQLSRSYLATLMPLGLLALLLGRKLARARLHRLRGQGLAQSEVLVVGGHASANHLADWFAQHPAGGFRVRAMWDPTKGAAGQPGPSADGAGASAKDAVTVLPATLSLVEALAASKASTVIITDTESLGNDWVRDTVWTLEGTGLDLFLSPNLRGFDSSRLHLHDIFSMPMLEVTEPTYAGASGWRKGAFDRAGALASLIILSPILVATAVAIKATSAGPVFYRQERIGLRGTPFGMIKFRSMRPGSDSELENLLAAEGKTLEELPKLTDDPRVTSVGRFIRRFSIDELPQLVNVLRGDMSLVGPRPQRHFEVAKYDTVANRRLSVRPGMTGLWQVSGRSNLSFDEAIALDVRYVENWSIVADVMILWKTIRAVVTSDGAI